MHRRLACVALEWRVLENHFFHYSWFDSSSGIDLGRGLGLGRGLADCSDLGRGLGFGSGLGLGFGFGGLGGLGAPYVLQPQSNLPATVAYPALSGFVSNLLFYA